ncbi:MAG: hypothetical protein R8K49_06880 [Mariprofundaceae bacterium]
MFEAMTSMDGFAVLLDSVIMVVMIGLWYLWWKQAQQRKKIESSLLEAAQQLETATRLLDGAMQQMSDIQENAKPHKALQVKQPEPAVRVDEALLEVPVDDVKVNFSTRAMEMSQSQAQRPSRPEPSHATGSVGSSQMAQILRMQREGVKADDIATTLDIPLAKVKLMLMVQNAQ